MLAWFPKRCAARTVSLIVMKQGLQERDPYTIEEYLALERSSELVVVVCDEPQFEDAELDTLLNSTVVVEVLSKTSEARDRGEKFSDYRGVESVKEIVFVSQHRMRVEHYVRQSNDEWTLHDIGDPAGLIVLSSIGCTLTLAEIYKRAEFPPLRRLRDVKRESQGEGE
jgi:Putative restriction endonuclease